MVNERSRKAITAAAIAALLMLATAARADTVSFEGAVARGDVFARRFTHEGATYEFRLVPVPRGWQIWIGDPARRDRNYVTVATPPYRGINPSRIEGWHFRNADNRGANRAGRKNVNAPQTVRRFAFTPDEAAYRAAIGALDTLLWPGDRPQSEIDATADRLRKIAKTEGRLKITSLELANLTVGTRAWIERLDFTVSIHLRN